MRHLLPAFSLIFATGLASQESPSQGASGLVADIERYTTDRAALARRYPVPMSPARQARMQTFYHSWQTRIAEIDFITLNRDGRIDWLLFDNHLRREQRRLTHESRRDEEIDALVPFHAELVKLCEAQLRREGLDPRNTAELLDKVGSGIEKLRSTIDLPETKRTLRSRAADRIRKLRSSLRNWYRFHDGYDPQFSWWVRKPYEKTDSELRSHAEALTRSLAGEEHEDAPIIGDPIGRDALLDELKFEMVSYTPEELIAIAKKELAWCEGEMLRASRQLGFGGDWQEALAHVKTKHVSPGEQPELIVELAQEAIEFLEERDLITIPDLAKELWRIEMMSPARQKVNPYFTGGEIISISFPTDGMEHRDKLMSLRGNNRHFARATVHHELIPGHHLQQFMTTRHRTHRRVFSTPFWLEGWALYWELRLWDLGFPKSAEDRVGMLFWRMHRCARIIFSLSFHLGQMTASEAIEFLIERVGHERNNATAEVRRSVQGGYGPLYQAAYMLGGLALIALNDELVKSGVMTEREFHDAVLHQNSIPIGMLRATLSSGDITQGTAPEFRFYDRK